MTLATNIADGFTTITTAVKTLRVMVTGSSTGGLSGLTTTDKTSLIAAINEVKAGASGAPPRATETVVGVTEIATQAETNTGTADNVVVTPLKFQTRLAAYAQPLSANLTSLAGVVSSASGRGLLGAADAPAARSALGLSAVASSGSAADLTGTLPSSLLPPLAINETHVVASQAAMLALSAQRGDIAKRTDLNGQAFVLSTDSPATLADWVSLNTTSDVTSVAGRTGAVVLTKTDVGLANVDNTADSAKPVSTAQNAAIATRLEKSANLSDVANPATARTNLGAVAAADVGDVNYDYVALVNAALA